MTGTIEVLADQNGIIYVPFAPTLLNEDDTPMEGTATLHSNPITVPIDSEGVADFGYVPTGNHNIIVNNTSNEELLNDTLSLSNGNENVIEDKHITILERSLMKIKRNESKKIKLIAPIILCPEDAPLENGYCTKLATPNYSCDSGTLSGTTCSQAATSEKTCTGVGGSLSGSKCWENATKWSYYCYTGTLNGSKCSMEADDKSGYEMGNAECGDYASNFGIIFNNQIYPSQEACKADVYYVCARNGYNFYVERNDNCYFKNIYTCESRWTLSGTTCTTPADKKYTCSSGWTVSGTQCYKAAATSYTCPTGWTKSGTTCSKSASLNYVCEEGWTVSGTSCIKEPGK